MRIEFTLSIGYRRRRPDIADRWEARVDSLGLMVVGGLVAVLILILVLPKLIDWITHLGG